MLADGDSFRRRRGFKRPGWTARAVGPYDRHVTENRPGARRVWRGVTATSYARAATEALTRPARVTSLFASVRSGATVVSASEFGRGPLGASEPREPDA